MVSVTRALAASSRNRLVYRITSDGGATGNIDASGAATPDLLTDSVAGELHDLLATVVADQAAARVLAFTRNDLLIGILPGDADAAWIIDANSVGATALRLSVTAAGVANLNSYLEIIYRDSKIR